MGTKVIVLAVSTNYLTYLEGLGAGGEGDDRG